MKKFTQFLMMVLSLVAFLAACTAAELVPGAPAAETPGGTAEETPAAGGTDYDVNDISVLLMESFPVQVSVTVRGDLSNGCVVLHGLTPVAGENGNWLITIDTSRDPDMLCTEALVPFAETVMLDVLDVPAGTYTVTAGDQSTTFTLDVDNTLPQSADPRPVITLERTPCFGACPVYTVTVYSDGTAVYEGRDFVEQTGEHSEIIGVEGVDYLVSQFQDVGYLEWQDAYTNREMTDMPSAITSLMINGQTKRIDHYHGDSSAPEALTALEDLVDEVVNTAQWIDSQAPDDQATPDQPIGLANPATEYCLQQGGRGEVRTDSAGNQYGVCIFEDGGECDEWAYFRGQCLPSTEIAWNTAVDLINGGSVAVIYQLHDLTVTLDLKDGRTLHTVEPNLDDVFKVIDECGEACADVVLATE